MVYDFVNPSRGVSVMISLVWYPLPLIFASVPFFISNAAGMETSVSCNLSICSGGFSSSLGLVVVFSHEMEKNEIKRKSVYKCSDQYEVYFRYCFFIFGWY